MANGTAVILPENGRSRQILDINESIAGKIIRDVVIEKDAVSLTCYTASLQPGASIELTIEYIGNHPDNRRVLQRIGPISQAGGLPITERFNVPGTLRITAEFTGAVIFDLQGRAITGSAAIIDTVQNVSIVTTDEDRIYRQQHISELHSIHETLEAILNHQRLITRAEEPIGDKF